MRKTKVTCFRYHRYNDVYVSNVAFSINTLLSILDIFPDQKIIVLIESDANDVQTLSSVAKNIGLAEVMSLSNVSSFLMACSKKELLCLLNLVDMNDFEGMFIANISNDIIPYAPICSLAHTASAMVKDGTSDVSIAINFPENQMVISLSKEKYAMTSIKDRIYNIFAN